MFCRSALSACVIVGLPNVRDYIHQHRERLMEEKRQKMLALESRQPGVTHNQDNHQQVNIPSILQKEGLIIFYFRFFKHKILKT